MAEMTDTEFLESLPTLAEILPPCAPRCPGDCGWDPSDPDDPCGTSDG